MKKNTIPIVTVSILGLGLVGSIFPAICVANRTFVKDGELADYRTFLNQKGTYECTLTFNGEHKLVYDNDMRVMKCLKTITPIDDNNHFPYVRRDNHCYMGHIIWHDNYILSLNEEGNGCVIEYHSDNRIYEAFKYYVFNEEDAQKINATFRSLVEDESNENQ